MDCIEEDDDLIVGNTFVFIHVLRVSRVDSWSALYASRFAINAAVFGDAESLLASLASSVSFFLESIPNVMQFSIVKDTCFFVLFIGLI